MLIIRLNLGAWVRIGEARVRFERDQHSDRVKLVIDAPPHVQVQREDAVRKVPR